jgi:hypothetical protein
MTEIILEPVKVVDQSDQEAVAPSVPNEPQPKVTDNNPPEQSESIEQPIPNPKSYKTTPAVKAPTIKHEDGNADY